ncbi:LysE family translocator [Streptomyces sp. NPDC053493]|uniref:LysE family translocator n=1 Tax=Streptomyces sp. NPDC053493 TaxID=3365705 RepID=UPI0037CF247A
MVYELLAATGVLALLTMVPGPDMAVVTRRAVAAGRGDGLRTVAGITTGLLVWGVLSVAGLAAVLAASATAYTVVKLAGAAYLLVLGVQALRAARRGGHDEAATPVRTPPPAGDPWRTGLVGNVLNPKIAVFYTSLLPTLAPHGLSPHTGMALLVLVHAALTVCWLGGYVLLLSRARAFFTRSSVRRGMERITGVVLIGFGLKVATAQA